MDPNPSNDSQAVLDAIRRIVRALRVAAKAVERDSGVSAAQLFVLRKLSDGRVLSVNELAERTLTHASSVSVVIAKLAARGFVTRRASPRDARRMEIAITSKGRTLAGGSPEVIQDRMITALAAMGGDERRQLACSLTRLITDAGFGDESAGLFFEDEHSTSNGAADDGDGDGGSGKGGKRDEDGHQGGGRPAR